MSLATDGMKIRLIHILNRLSILAGLCNMWGGNGKKYKGNQWFGVFWQEIIVALIFPILWNKD